MISHEGHRGPDARNAPLHGLSVEPWPLLSTSRLRTKLYSLATGAAQCTPLQRVCPVYSSWGLCPSVADTLCNPKPFFLQAGPTTPCTKGVG